ncbi:MAG: tRNA pseudouridine(55) synthase TruB [Firmicutes bacterium]|nr:tRNA pseudouridine(55) synthase TruB [Bacillota bacterium]MBR4024683.1 tRNA pseudouridine(55) synthase TruB [Bacillota bacterium]
MKDGIINVYKPSGITSNDVIYKVRAALGIKKLGHTGTLDPMAEGVLPILINRGTRIAEYLDWDLKTYKAAVRLGVRTDSLDITGNVEETADPSGITEADIIGAFAKLMGSEVGDAEAGFSGILDQIPPMTSAVRIEGRRLYEYVHQGDEIPEEIRERIRPRRVWIENLRIEDISLPEIRFSVTCSKGTYIRSISRDIGEILGCGAVLTELKRSASGAFTEENAVSLEELVKAAMEAGRVEVEDPETMKLRRTVPFGEDIPEDMERFVLGVDFPLVHFGEAMVSPENARRFLDGWHLGYREVSIIKKPEQDPWIMDLGREAEAYNARETEINSGSHAGLKLHPEYLSSYKIYRNDGGGMKTFVGIARHSDRYHKLVPDKVFLRI